MEVDIDVERSVVEKEKDNVEGPTLISVNGL